VVVYVYIFTFTSRKLASVENYGSETKNETCQRKTQ